MPRPDTHPPQPPHAPHPPRAPEPPSPPSKPTGGEARKGEDSGPLAGIVALVRGDLLLWPVAAVFWLVVCTFGSFVLFYALRVRSLMAGTALLLLIFFTVFGLDRDIRRRRLSPENALVLSLWAGSALGALASGWIEF